MQILQKELPPQSLPRKQFLLPFRCCRRNRHCSGKLGGGCRRSYGGDFGCRRPGYRNCRVQERHGDQGNGRGSEGRKENDAGEVLVTISVQKATIEDKGYDALQKVLDQQSSDTYELAQEAWGDMQAFLEDNDWETTGSLYGIEDTISMKRGDDRIFSYVTTDYSYLGGAHPNVVYNGYNYDTKTGKG